MLLRGAALIPQQLASQNLYNDKIATRINAIMSWYSYETKCCPIRVWASHMSIRVWDVPYAYGPTYAYGAEQIHYIATVNEYVCNITNHAHTHFVG